MPAIQARKQADGSTRYTAVVRIRRQGKVLHQEARTFAYRSAAERWGKQREVALEDPAALVRAQQTSTRLATLIRWYIDSFQQISKWERSKRSQLVFLEKHPLGEADAVFLESATLIDHVRARRAKGADPTTSAIYRCGHPRPTNPRCFTSETSARSTAAPTHRSSTVISAFFQVW